MSFFFLVYKAHISWHKCLYGMLILNNARKKKSPSIYRLKKFILETFIVKPLSAFQSEAF